MTNYEALDKLNRLANERFNLYRQAGSTHLSPLQLQRIHEIENQLIVLWDEHRREVAAEYWGSRNRTERRFDFSDERAFKPGNTERNTRLEDGKRLAESRRPAADDFDGDIELSDEDILIA